MLFAMAVETTTPPARGYAANKDQLQKRLRRVEGQVRGVQGMVEEDRWCPDILQQIAAVQAALDKVALGLAEGHVQHCMMAGADDPARSAEMTHELMTALGRLVR
jgi:DNA-binding FrmR family transcriptional regulator